jgi:signal transduction histidine kinase/HAMP domain-containing protein
MRDPLSLIPVRYKLPLTFAFLCTVAFGFGGYIVLSTAREALEKQIEARLEERAATTDMLVDKGLELLGRRVEDYASDGYIRLELERLEAGSVESNEELVRHLRANKLPLVEEITDAYLLDRDGNVLVWAEEAFQGGAENLAGSASPVSFNKDAFWYGPLSGPGPLYNYPNFILSTPVRAIQGGGLLGYLQLVVHAEKWADGLRKAFPETSREQLRIGVGYPGGYRLSLYPKSAGGQTGSAAAAPTDDDWFTMQTTSAHTGWIVDVGINSRIMQEPVRSLVWKFIYLGIALVFLAMLLLLPSLQFLLKPLSRLEAAAKKLTDGDFSARVGYKSDDEVGHLSTAFDVMAAAIEEHTQRLSQAARDVRVERDRLNTVIHSMKDGLFILDRQGKVFLANGAAQVVLEEIAKVRQADRTGDCLKTSTGSRNCLQCLSDYSTPPRNCVSAIGSRTYEIRATALLDPAGQETGRVFVSRDITERILRTAQEAHHERLSVLGEVAAVMAHEMNNPLAAISMFNQMMMKDLEPGSDLYAHAEVVGRNTETCSRAIRSLLDMVRPEAAEYERFEIADTVNDVIQMLRPIADRNRVDLQFSGPAQKGPVRGDELQLRQAVVNLVMNGIQATHSNEEPGNVRLEVKNRDDEIVLTVQDDGPGVSDELHDRIFEPFFTTKPAGEGTGLGLPTTRRIIDAHGGRIAVRAATGGGAIFEITLPHADEPALNVLHSTGSSRNEDRA